HVALHRGAIQAPQTLDVEGCFPVPLTVHAPPPRGLSRYAGETFPSRHRLFAGAQEFVAR
ncbi:hypothetical protein, partial [Salmonella sp. SAL4447]|uniref:hypothetical protein n=1 Tax=Salmonella sp. SAL4447 TaxID=3159902 RepID=UPI00397C4DFD